MIAKIIKDKSKTLGYRLVYLVHDEDGEFGYIGLKRQNIAVFKLTEEKYLTTDELGFIFQHALLMQDVANGKAMDILQDEYYFPHEPRPTKSSDTARK